MTKEKAENIVQCNDRKEELKAIILKPDIDAFYQNVLKNKLLIHII